MVRSPSASTVIVETGDDAERRRRTRRVSTPHWAKSSMIRSPTTSSPSCPMKMASPLSRVNGCGSGRGRAAADHHHRIREPLAASIRSHVDAEDEIENRQPDASDGLHRCLRIERAEPGRVLALLRPHDLSDQMPLVFVATARMLTTDVPRPSRERWSRWSKANSRGNPAGIRSNEQWS